MERSRRHSVAPLASICSVFRTCMRDVRAASAAEYALILAIIGAVIALASLSLSEHLGNRLGRVDEPTILVPSDIRTGQGAFIKPEIMNTGGWYPIEFVAGPTLESLKAETEELELTTPRPIYVGESMRVRLLKDPNFEIRAKSKDLQQTGPDITATWQWDVKPTAIGTHKLIAQVDVLKRRKDGKYDLFNRYSRRVSVHVTVGTMQSIIDGIRNAEWLGNALSALFRSWGAMLIALGLLIGAAFGVRWRIRKFRRRAPRPDELEEIGKA